MRSDPARSGNVISVRNEGTEPRTIVVENAKFSRNRLTLGRLAAIPAFREFCPDQLLRAGQAAGIGQVAILFSDLQSSTALYEEIGDATAYSLVVSHFEFIEEQVRASGGVVIKTVGDAVMAAFADSSAALSAATEIQAKIADFNAEHDHADLTLKIGIHDGSCVAMRSDAGLDFFGSTVNMAARLQGQANGGEIVLSEEMAESNKITERADLRIDWDEATLSGFEAPFRFARIRLAPVS